MGNVPSRSWPSKRQADQFGAPTNAQVGRVQDLVRPHPLNDATSAADILADAVFYIDAQEHAADGGNVKTVRNRGWGGSVLNARCGSTSVPDTNDPRFLAAEQSAYVYLPGVNNNYLSVPDATDLRITGDIDARFLVAFDDWTPASEQSFGGKYGNVGDRGWYMTLRTDGRLDYNWSTNGTASVTKTSSVATGVPDGTAKWIRVTHDVDNGASGNDVKFWTSDDGISWTQLGTTQNTAGTTNIYAATVPVSIGTWSSTNFSLIQAGRVYRAIIKNGIDGTTVLDVDTNVLTTGSATSFTATTGQTVTINRSTSGRKTVVVPDRSRSGGCWLFGTDDYMEVPLSATGSRLLDFGPNDSFTVLAVVRQWGTQINNARYISKRQSGIGNFYYLHSANTTTSFTFDTSRSIISGSGTLVLGALSVLAGTILAAISTTYSNAAVARQSLIGSGDLTNSLPMRIGRDSGTGTSYQDAEVMAVAIFRRALTAAEIATLTTEFQRRYA